MSKIKVNEIEAQSGSTITIPTGQNLVVTDGLATSSLPTVPVTKGGTGLTSLGTANQELRVNSGATALEFYTPTVATSNYEKIAETQITTSLTAITFNAVFSGSDYHVYHLYHNDVRLGTTGAELYLRMRRSGADISSGNYNWVVNIAYDNNSGGSGQSHSSGRGSTFARLAGQDFSGASGDHASSGIATFVNPTKSAHPSGGTAVSNWKYFYTNGFAFGNGGTNATIRAFNGGGLLADTGAIDGVTIYASSGNLEAGNFILYGVKR